MTAETPPGRAAIRGSRRVDVLVVLAVLLPTVVVASLALVRGDEEVPGAEPPVRSALTRSTVVCPSPVARPAGDVGLTRMPGVDGGEVEVRVSDGAKTRKAGAVDVGEGLATVPSSGAATIASGAGTAAPGLVAGRDGRGAVPECREPWYDEWFVGLGAAARESSVIELVNPDGAQAVVDIEIVGPEGPIEDASWRGVTVGGHSVERVQLAERPAREAIAAHVTVSRGRVSAAARHTWDELGRSNPTTDFVPAQSEPATENLLLGLPEQGARRRLHVANPGDDEVRATVKIVTADATFVPAGSEDVTVPPRSQVAVGLNRYLDGEAAAGMLGLLLESSGPVAAGVRTVIDGDLQAIGPVAAHSDAMVAVVPRGEKTLTLGGATGPGTVTITATAANGRVVWEEERFEVSEGHAVPVELPRRAVRIEVESSNTPVAATLVATDDQGPGVMRLAPARIAADVPSVRPDTP